MWRKLTIAGALAILALIAFGILSFAASPNSVSQETLTMQGQAVAIPDDSQLPQIRLKVNSNGNNGWLLEAVLNVTGSRYYRYRENQTLNVNGSFTLGTEQQPISSGTAAGWINPDGSGDIQLAGQNGNTSLDMSFSIAQDGSVTSTVQGQWPVMSTNQPGVQQPSNHFYWYLSRTSAIAAYILLFISICLGIGFKSKYLKPVLGQWRALDLHQFTMLLAGSLVALHIFSLLGDSYFSFNLSDLLIPMASPYRPLWIALGIVGFYAGLIIVLSNCIRKFLRQKAWRTIHYSSYILFFIILFHGVLSGTDTATPWVQWLYISTGTIVAFLSLWRFLDYKTAGTHQPGYRTKPQQT